jgi:predicted acylesterase/phospholipase RssA
LDEHLEEEIEKTNNELAIAELEYKKTKMKKWFTCALGIFIGFILGIEIPKITNFLFNAKYDRSSLDKLMKDYLGKSTIDQVLSNEVLIVSYEYNSQQPRFYSKYFAREDPNVYNIMIGNATAASSSAPTFFDPKVQVTKYNRTEILVDGGVICNNPAYYAYQITKSFNDVSKKVRLLSLGTGEKSFTKIDPKSVHKYTFLKMSGEFMMNIDTYTGHWALKKIFKSDPTNYIRANIVTELSMDANSKENIDGLLANG